MTFANFIQEYPGECKKVQQLKYPLISAHFAKEGWEPVYRCAIKHRGEHVTPQHEEKINEESLYIHNGVIFEVELQVDPKEATLSHLHEAYGPSFEEKHPGGFEDRSSFGMIDYSVGNYTATTDSLGSFYSRVFSWSACDLEVIYDYSSSHSFSGGGRFTNTVTFGTPAYPLPGCPGFAK
jgi:hypothetical protein